MKNVSLVPPLSSFFFCKKKKKKKKKKKASYSFFQNGRRWRKQKTLYFSLLVSSLPLAFSLSLSLSLSRSLSSMRLHAPSARGVCSTSSAAAAVLPRLAAPNAPRRRPDVAVSAGPGDVRDLQFRFFSFSFFATDKIFQLVFLFVRTAHPLSWRCVPSTRAYKYGIVFSALRKRANGIGGKKSSFFFSAPNSSLLAVVRPSRPQPRFFCLSLSTSKK